MKEQINYMKRNHRRQLALIVGLATLVALVFSACGDSKKGGSDETAKSSDVAKYENALAALYKGDFEPPSGKPIDPPKGKDIWLITLGMNIEPSQNIAAGVKEAASALDWDVTVFDGKFESSRWLTGIQQAIAAKADGIILFVIDCETVQAGMEQAAAAGVPVVTIESRECDPPLATYGLTFARGQDFEEWLTKGFAPYQAKWLVAETKGQAKAIVVYESDLVSTRIVVKPIEEVFEECPTCEVVDKVAFVGTEIGPPLQAKIEQSLNQHPEANAFLAPFDGVMTIGGGAAALRASGRLEDMAIMGGEGSAPGIELIYEEAGIEACSGIYFQSESYGAMMGMALIFRGEDPYGFNSGIGSQVCDLEHNLPPKGEPFQPPLDYLAEYEKLWNLK